MITDEDIRERARALYADDDIDIDENAEVARATDSHSAWVAAWVRVDLEGMYDQSPT